MSDRITTLHVEGADGTGKQTLVEALAKELSAKGTHVLLFRFPQYGTPLGQAIRLMNKGKFDNIFDRLSILDETRIRATMFALDRLVALSVLDSIGPNTAVLFDRSWMSNAITAAFVSSRRHASEPERRQIAEMLSTLEPEFAKGTQGQMYLCRVPAVLINREPEDIYEKAQIESGAELPRQINAYYEELARLTNTQLHTIDTRNSDNSWIPTSDLTQKVLQDISLPQTAARGGTIQRTGSVRLLKALFNLDKGRWSHTIHALKAMDRLIAISSDIPDSKQQLASIEPLAAASLSSAMSIALEQSRLKVQSPVVSRGIARLLKQSGYIVREILTHTDHLITSEPSLRGLHTEDTTWTLLTELASQQAEA